MIGPQGSGKGPLKDEGCKFKVKPVTRAVFFFSRNAQLCRLLTVGRKLHKTRVLVVVSPGKYDRRFSSYLFVTDLPGQRK